MFFFAWLTEHDDVIAREPLKGETSLTYFHSARGNRETEKVKKSLFYILRKSVKFNNILSDKKKKNDNYLIACNRLRRSLKFSNVANSHQKKKFGMATFSGY